ncbi:MAG: tyrosine-type recombinase/integrase, partial [Candidatus Competibacter sp.]|nr:tyrosine-type recombinase/integrase [Candidatus Competibacter sp.]
MASTLLGALFRFAAARYEHAGRPLILDNPVKRLASIRAWCDLPPRQGHIPPGKLGAWWQATETVDPTPRDLLRLLLLTGLRKSEGAGLRWEHIDMTGRTLHVPETKNRRPHTLPLSGALVELLAARLKDAERTGNPYVFPSSTGRGSFSAVLPACRRVATAAGVSGGMVHDLRRTFITLAEGLDVPTYALKALLNHHAKGDVTQGYLQIGIERLRSPMEAIARFILKAAGAMETAPVVEIPARRA